MRKLPPYTFLGGGSWGGGGECGKRTRPAPYPLPSSLGGGFTRGCVPRLRVAEVDRRLLALVEMLGAEREGGYGVLFLRFGIWGSGIGV